jgi:hypothetical protein
MHVRRRPSASMIVSMAALFVSLGGVGYAATTLPSGSVGTDQLQSGAVSNAKIKNGAVGHGKLADGAVGKTQINSSQVQARVTGTCAARGIASVTSSGAVSCATAGAEFDTSSASPVTIASGTTATTIASESLNGGSPYLVFANPEVDITKATEHQMVTTSCNLAVGPATTAQQTRTWTTEIGSGGDSQENSIPLVVTAPSSSNSITANLTCTSTVDSGTAPTVTVQSNINALQTASNTTAKQSSSSSG